MLHEAARYQTRTAIPLLITAGARFRRDSIGATPLHFAVSRGFNLFPEETNDAEVLEVCRALMFAPNSAKYVNAPITAAGFQARPLTLCSEYNWLETAKYLLTLGAQPNGGSLGHTAVQSVVARGFYELAHVLIDAGACTHPFYGKALISFLPADAPPNIRQRLRAVQTPAVATCDKCGHDIDNEDAAKTVTHDALRSSDCSNPSCPHRVDPKLRLTDHQSIKFVIPLKLKKCSRCRNAAYCSVECQKQHWKNGHQSLCTARQQQ
jgi:ankyrin repeat protein